VLLSEVTLRVSSSSARPLPGSDWSKCSSIVSKSIFVYIARRYGPKPQPPLLKSRPTLSAKVRLSPSPLAWPVLSIVVVPGGVVIV
jgi:hypothetical protein